jgi:HprK-related kinase A
VKICQLSRTELAGQLADRGLHLLTGPFIFRLHTRVETIVEGIRILYGEFPLVDSPEFADFHVSLVQQRNWRQCFRPLVAVSVDGEFLSTPLPVDQALAVFEGCLNWCIYTTAHQYLIIHAAAVEREGRAAILPAPPGAGKSTLCAALVNRGWRLLSDELTLVALETNTIVPLARPISLKNESIDIIRTFAPQAVFGPISPNTIKGTIAHMRAPAESVARVAEVCTPTWLVMPRYRPGVVTTVQSVPKGQAFMLIAGSSVNYMMHGFKGFTLLTQLVDAVDCYEFEYGDLHEAVSWFDKLTTGMAHAHTRACGTEN